MKNVVQFSGGKDSTAMLLLLLERGVTVDEIIFCDTGMEFPELYRHIKKVKEYIDRPITVLKPEHNFEYYLSEIVIQKGANAGKCGYGWPRLWHRWCTRAFKERLTRNYLKEKYACEEYKLFIGIAADEPLRHYRELPKNVEHPLFDWNITEADALRYCQSKGFDFGGLYERFRRLGCWCCPLQRLDSLRTLRRYYPELWQELLRLDAKAPYTFLKRYSAADLEEKFTLEEAQGKLF